MNRKIVELETLRGLAAICVVLAHLPPWLPEFHSIMFVRNSGGMVEFFFVLSGFVIAATYSDRIATFIDAAHFQFLRFGRLYPVHFLFLVVMVCYEGAKYFLISDPVAKAFVPGINGPRQLLENLFLVQALGFSNPNSFNGPSWTISTEFYTYAIFAAVMLVGWRTKVMFVALALAACGVLLAGWAGQFERLLLCCGGFFIGCVTALINKRMGVSDVTLPSVALPVSLIALVIYFMWARHTTVADRVMIFPLSSAVILSVTRTEDGPWRRALRWAPFAWLGLISYSLYMAHYPVIQIYDVILRRVVRFHTEVVNTVPVVQLTGAQFIVVFGALMALVVLTAAISYYAVEKPARDWSRRVSFRRHAQDAPVT